MARSLLLACAPLPLLLLLLAARGAWGGCSAPAVSGSLAASGLSCDGLATGARCAYRCPANEEFVGSQLQCVAGANAAADFLAGSSGTCQAPAATFFTTLGTNFPQKSHNPMLVWCARYARLILAGGRLYNDQTFISQDGSSWSYRAGHGSTREYTTGVCDANGKVYMIGGNDAGTLLNNMVTSTDIAASDEASGGTWNLSSAAAWTPRQALTSVLHPNGVDILIAGGSTDPGGSPTVAEVWLYTASTQTWTAQCQGVAECGWSARMHTRMAFVDQTLILVGGIAVGGWTGAMDDVWISTNYGVSWTQRVGSPAKGPQMAAAFVAYNGILHSVFSTDDPTPPPYWQSSDEGRSWYTATSSVGVSGRGLSGHTVFKNQLIIYGGSSDPMSKECIVRTLGPEIRLSWATADSTPAAIRVFQQGTVFHYTGSVTLAQLPLRVTVTSAGAVRVSVNGGSFATATSGMPFQLLSLTNGANTVRISTPDGVYTYAITTPTAGVTGDPHFVGFLGQEYEVHGVPDSIYALVSTPQLQENARFVFRSSGSCPTHVPEAECWSHPGTFLGSVGLSLLTGSKGQHSVLVESGSASEGLRVFVDGELLEVDAQPLDLVKGKRIARATLERRLARRAAGGSLSAATLAPQGLEEGATNSTLASSEEVAGAARKDAQSAAAKHPWSCFLVDHSEPGTAHVYTPDFHFQLRNSDHFLNQQVELFNLRKFAPLLASEVAAVPVHGVLGQTVRLRRYANRWRYLQGDIDEYREATLFSAESAYAHFSGQQREVGADDADDEDEKQQEEE